jgi:hypothetical protein
LVLKSKICFHNVAFHKGEMVLFGCHRYGTLTNIFFEQEVSVKAMELR